MTLPETLRAALAGFPQTKTYVLAFSGGVDSHALLHALVGLPVAVRAVHVNHGLHAQADAWAEQCAQVAQQYQVPFTVLRIDQSPAAGDSIEAWARQMRYRLLQGVVRSGEMLLTAQHQDDQAETLLLQLMRGAGLAGLAGMPACRVWGQGWMARPWLEVSRAQILAYAKAHQLQWIEDPSNEDERFDRNFLRQQVMPLLGSRWPALAANLSRSAAHIADADQQLLERDQRRLTACLGKNVLDVRVLSVLTHAEQTSLLRTWLRSHPLQLPSQAVLQQVLQQLEADQDARLDVRWGQHALRRYRHSLYLEPARLPSPPELPVSWRADDLQLPLAAGTLQCASTDQGLTAALFAQGRVTVRWHRSGDTYRLFKRGGRRSFKKICQELGIPVWHRPYVPLICVDDQVVSIAGRQWTQAFSSYATAQGCKPVWSGPAFF